jgi:hypothetical protein
MSSRPELKIDWCSHAAAKYAVEHWHYSKSLPAFKLAKLGAWEDGQFIGCAVFSVGACQHIASPFGITRTEVCELTRVALREHQSPVTKILSICLNLIRREYPGLRLVVSYADLGHGHHGGIYQGGNWIYCGTTKPDKEYFVRGKWVHHRQGNSLLGSVAGVKSRPSSQKHKYLMPLDDEMRRQIKPLRKPYPKRVRSADSGTSGNQPESGGATPTRTLSESSK